MDENTKTLDAVVQQHKNKKLIEYGIVIAIGIVLLGGVAIVVLGHYQTPKPVEAAVATSTPPVPNAYENVRLIGHAAIVYDLSTGETLYAQDADRQLPLASLTKLLTLYAATGVLQDKSPVTITKTALAQDGEYGFSEGETFAFKDIARLALVASSNDAAEAIGEAAQENKQVTGAQLMASAAAAAGLTNKMVPGLI
jgi:D-alanyl-D-alanine carboxypeptidase (penicillin-binding protein 5/6)